MAGASKRQIDRIVSVRGSASQPPRAAHCGCAATICDSAVQQGQLLNARAWPRGLSKGWLARQGYHSPVFSMLAQGSFAGRASPFWSNSMEMLSGERTNAM